jgi:N-acetylmuramoyl-L-alanine amidase
MMIRAWCLSVLFCISLSAAKAAELKAISVGHQAHSTSLDFTLKGPFTHRLFVLKNPDRVVVDLMGTQLQTNLNQVAINNPLIKHIRSGKPDANTLRLVFEVQQPVQVSSTLWKEHGAFKGIRVNLVAGAARPSAVLLKPKAINNPQPLPKLQVQLPVKKVSVAYSAPVVAHKTPIKVPHSPSRSLRDVVVVLDAGHGGKDPGAKGPSRSREKDVVLAITLKLKRLIDRQRGMHAVLTRSGDYYVGLRERLEIARKYNGDIFVSIHADAFNNPHSNGASVFALSQSGATSEAARWIAEKENYSELGGVNLGDLDDQNGVVRSVLIDLSQTSTINSSVQMGSRVLRQFNSFTSLHNSKVEQARFMVLKSPDIPSILVETGFISNPREERNLTSYAYQMRLSRAIFEGIKGYFWESPPHGTRIEAMTASRFHLVKAGESLPSIARQYHVTVGAIKEMNSLGVIAAAKPGQKLAIPSTWA